MSLHFDSIGDDLDLTLREKVRLQVESVVEVLEAYGAVRHDPEVTRSRADHDHGLQLCLVRSFDWSFLLIAKHA